MFTLWFLSCFRCPEFLLHNYFFLHFIFQYNFDNNQNAKSREKNVRKSTKIKNSIKTMHRVFCKFLHIDAICRNANCAGATETDEQNSK